MDSSTTGDRGLRPRRVALALGGEARPHHAVDRCPLTAAMDSNQAVRITISERERPHLVKWIADLAAHALQMERNEIFYPVPLHPDAQVLLDAFEREATATIREAGVDVFRQSWNRAHENALRLATALAVADAPHAPQVTVAHAEWAIAFVRRSVRTVVRRFETGEAGGSETNKGYTEIMKKAKEHPHLSAAKLRSYKVPIPMIGTPVIPFVYFKRRLVAPSAVSPFNEKDGTDRLKKALRELMETGDLARPSAEQLKKLGIPPTADVYVLGPNWK